MDARRHVCIVTETYSPEINGVALTLARLVEGLRRRGHVVSVVRPHPRASWNAGNDDPHVTVVPGVPLPGYGELRLGLPAVRRLSALWAIHRPDVVYAATEGPLGWSAMRVAKRLRLPVFSGFHTNVHAYARHYDAGWLAPAIRRYLRHFHNATGGTLVATVELGDEIRTLGVRNIRVVGRGVDSRLFNPARRSLELRATWGVAKDDLVALYVGRIAPEKDIPLAIEAYRTMLRTSRATRLVLVGDGPARAELEAAHPDLRFCGVQRGEALAVHYASADVFLFPSATETFGNVVLEAMASGLGVVAYDYAAAHVHVRDGETGGLAPRGDTRAFIERAATLAGSPDLPHIRRQARQHALKSDWQKTIDQFERVLVGSLDEHPGPPASTGTAALLDTIRV